MMTLKQGAFYKDGERVPMEFGNKEQIKLLERVEELCRHGEDVFLLESFSINSEETYGFDFKCLCGCKYERVFKNADEANAFEKEQFKCPGCGLQYLIASTEDEFFLSVKLIKPKK